MHKTLVKTFGKIVKKVSKHGRLILTVTSIVGLGESVYITAKVAPKAKEALMEAREEKGEDLTLAEKAKIAAPIYIPVAVSTACTAGLIIFNHKLGTKRINKALAAAVAARRAYIGLAEEYCGFKEVTKEVAGEELYSKITDKFGQKKIDKALEKYTEEEQKNIVENAPGSREKGSMLCWIPSSPWLKNDVLVHEYDNFDPAGEFFWATPEELDAAEARLNKHFQEHGWTNIDQFRGYFDLPYDGIKDLGWNMRCECWSNFYGDSGWLNVSRYKGKVANLDCWIIEFDIKGLCDKYRDACVGDKEEEPEPLPFI